MHNEFKRIPIKYVRDLIKKNYKKISKCYICNSSQDLEFHHLHSIAELWNNWCSKNKVTINTVIDIKTHRVKFEEEHREILKDTVTLCKPHHERLHSIFGQRYNNIMVPRIKKWIDNEKGSKIWDGSQI